MNGSTLTYPRTFYKIAACYVRLIHEAREVFGVGPKLTMQFMFDTWRCIANHLLKGHL